MKVSHFLISLNPKYGGPTASVQIQCVGVKNEGADVTLVTYTESRPFEDKLFAAGVYVTNLEHPKSRLSQMFQWGLRSFLKKDDDADIYHYHGVWLPCNHWVSKAARRQKKAYIINPRGDLEIYRINYNKWKKLKKMIIWHLYGRSDTQDASCVLTTSQQEANAVRQLGITAPVAIIPNGIDLSGFPMDVVHSKHDKKVVLFLSRVNPIKGLELLIDAWDQLPEALSSNWELHIAGNSDPADYIYLLKNKVKRLDLTHSIKFLGPITGETKIKKYLDSDLFILPSFNENFGNVIAEAMMCECPVITTKNAPWSCLIEYECGWWIDLSVENLVKTLTESMSLTDEQRYELGRKGRQCIINGYSSESVAKKTYVLYEWVLGQRGKPEFVHTID